MFGRISEIIYKLINNSIESKASLIILDYIEINRKELKIFIFDNRIIDETSKNDDGLQIKKECDTLAVKLEIEAGQKEGNSIYLELNLLKPENPSELFTKIMTIKGNLELVINRIKDKNKYSLIRSEIIAEAGSSLENIDESSIKKYIIELEKLLWEK